MEPLQGDKAIKNDDVFPDEISLGYFEITIPTNSREHADQHYESFIKKVKNEFKLKHKNIAGLYALDFEIEDVTDGSKKYHTKPKLKLKKKWKTLKKLAPKGWVLTLLLATGVVNYPDFKEGAIEIYDDLNAIVEMVADNERSDNTPLAPKIDSCRPDDMPPTYRA